MENVSNFNYREPAPMSREEAKAAMRGSFERIENFIAQRWLILATGDNHEAQR